MFNASPVYENVPGFQRYIHPTIAQGHQALMMITDPKGIFAAAATLLAEDTLHGLHQNSQSYHFFSLRTTD